MSGNPGGRAGRLSHGALSSHALMDSGVKAAGSAVGAGSWSSGHVRASAYYPGGGVLTCPSQLELQYSTNLSFLFFIFFFLVRN